MHNFLKFAFILLDIMECKDGLHNCSQICVEREGEFGCACYSGYELLEDGISCKGMYVCTCVRSYLILISYRYMRSYVAT